MLTREQPDFIRAYLRKAQALHAMKEFNKCIDVCSEAMAHDKEGKNTREIEAQSQKALQAQYEAREGETDEQAQERIQRDPDIMAILQDPVMQSILQQAKSDPKVCFHVSIHKSPHYNDANLCFAGTSRTHEGRWCPQQNPEADGCGCH